MDLIFVLLTQLMNETTYTLDFEVVDHPRGLLPELPPGETDFARTSRVHRKIKKYEPKGWKCRVLLNGEFTGIEIDPGVIVSCVRVVFRVQRDGGRGDVLSVHVVPEIPGLWSIDVWYRHRFLGFMRNSNWNARESYEIGRSDSKSATELRNKDGHCQHLAPFVDSEKRNTRDPKYKEDEIEGPLAKPRFKHARDDSKNNPESQRPKSATVAVQQVGPRDGSRSSRPLVKPRTQVSIDDGENYINIPRPHQPPNDITTTQRARRRNDESPTNGVQQVESRDVTRPLDLPVKPRRQVNIDDNKNCIDISRPQQPPNNVATTQRTKPKDDESPTNGVQQVGPRDVTRPLDPLVKPRRRVSTDGDENYINIHRPQQPSNDVATTQRTRPIDDESHTNGIQQVGPEDATRPLDLPVRPRRWINTNDSENYINIPRPQQPPNDAVTIERARPMDDESPINVVQKDSFVYGILFAFALLVSTLIMI